MFQELRARADLQLSLKPIKMCNLRLVNMKYDLHTYFFPFEFECLQGIAALFGETLSV